MQVSKVWACLNLLSFKTNWKKNKQTKKLIVPYISLEFGEGGKYHVSAGFLISTKWSVTNIILG
jgi:hypothetical protein